MEAQDCTVGLGLLLMYKQYTKSNRNSIKFFLSNQIRSEIKVNMTKPYRAFIMVCKG